jgi:hypothetical protein
MLKNDSEQFPKVCCAFFSMEWNSEHFYLSRNGSERNSESFLFRGTAGIPSELTICSVNSVFRGIIILSEIANPTSWLLKARSTDSYLFLTAFLSHWTLPLRIKTTQDERKLRKPHFYEFKIFITI